MLGNTYERTVAAATAETASKFRLAEALALDIPPQQRGPASGTTVPEYLAEAREAIRQAGGEPRHVNTLDEYRRTALWVSGDLSRNFGWVPGVSYSAHNEARKHGVSLADFTTRPRTVDVIRQEAGQPGTDGPAAKVAARAVRDMTTDERAGLAKDILTDPDTADKVMADRNVREEAFRAAMRNDERDNLHRPRPTPTPPPALTRAMAEMQDSEEAWCNIGDELRKEAQHLQGSELLREDPKFRELILTNIGLTRNQLDLVESIVNGGGVTDEALANLLNGGGK